MAAGRIHNFAFFLLTFYFPNWPINQFESIMQNKPNLLNALMNVSPFITRDYENKSNWKLGENKANTNPILSAIASGEGGTKPIQSQFPKSQNERNFYFNKGL